jgi:D-amino-acid dehydrogenase
LRRNPQVLVIGGGVIGLCSAYYLRRQGNEVTLLDKGYVGGPQSCSFGNAGYISPSGAVPLSEPGVIKQGLKWMLDPESPFYIKPRLNYDLILWLIRFAGACNEKRCAAGTRVLRNMKIRSIELFRELNALDDFSCGFTESGKLRVYNTQEGFDAGRRAGELIKKSGGDVEILTADQVRKMEPDVPLNICGGIYNGEDGYINPTEFSNQLARLIEKMGVRIHSFGEAYDFESDHGAIRKVKTTLGDFSPAEIALTTGSWTSDLARQLGFKLPVQPGKGYSITVRKPSNSPRIPIMLSEGKVAVTPLGDYLRFAGTMELSGMDLSFTARRITAILKTVRNYMPTLEKTEIVQVWRGLRPCTPDGIPFIGRSGKYRNLTIACGHAMIGLGLAPITGKLVSQIINGLEPEVDLTPLRINRFHGTG